ncbi:hypothetical protein TREMEDRAFT_30323, partial [Tremella mesenterica DSM 1558]|uniref:uncharacterized protein n=1 Tax=Tremella mesenterica (strain ATCC 24925 / CBS 8224 / DSM 1558 / NBRC 9311 / NRRL Y-6157 / RJB 2259-6 / UBC 559-6) TaxID=578456 RepID=UPI0003F492EC
LSSINAQLLSHGWAKRPLNLDALTGKDYEDVVGVLFELLGSSVTNLETLDSILAKHRTLSYEHERLTKSHHSRALAIARLEGETQGWKSRCNELERRLVLEEAKTKELREEVGRGKKALESVRVAANHQSKKTQIKLDKALTQIARFNNDATLLSRPHGVTILNPIPSNRNIPTHVSSAPMIEQALRDLAEIRESLQEETEAFRHVVISAGNGLREAIAAYKGEEMPPRFGHVQFFAPLTASSSRHLSSSSTHTSQSSSSTSHPTLANARLQTLISEIREQLLSGQPPASRLDSVDPDVEVDVAEREKMEREQLRVIQDLEDRLKDLQMEVSCAKAREEEASRLLTEAAREKMKAGISTKPIDDLAEEIEEVRGQRELAKQQDSFEQERKRFAQERYILAAEKRKLELERQAFVEEQRQADLAAMRAYLPATPEEGIKPPLPMQSTSSPIGGSFHDDHRPISPSPLSPHHVHRTPKQKHHLHAARRKSVKTPLSRLVLEKAVRNKGKDAAVLGEGGRRANVDMERRMVSGSSNVKSGVRKASNGSSVSSDDKAGKVRGKVTGQLGVSQRKIDLTKSIGMAQSAVKGAKVWR